MKRVLEALLPLACTSDQLDHGQLVLGVDPISGNFANILLLLVERGFIDARYKLEILELNREFEENRKKLRDQSAVLNFAMPSLSRIHKMFETMKGEILMAEAMRDQLSSLMSKIE